MAYEIVLPHVGESVTEAVISKWLKSPGDSIEKYEPLVEVITDKVNMDVPAPESGVLGEILVNEGDTVAMGAVIARMETGDSVQANSDPKPISSRIGTLVQGANVGPTGGEFTDTSLATAPTSATKVAAPKSETGSRNYSPVVTRLAAKHGIDLSTVTGSGLGGRVTKKDVLAAVESGGHTELAPVSEEDQVIEPTPIRKMIAEHMVRSVSEIPHAWSAIEVDVTGLVQWRDKNRSEFEALNGVKLTYFPIMLYVVASSLRQNPKLNSSWQDGKIVSKGQINVGVAVASASGLVVPVVNQADKADLSGITRKFTDLVSKARNNKLDVTDVQGGTFTLNNTGALGSVWGGAIINHPQAAILTTEAIVKRPVVISGPTGDSIAVRSMMNMCLSFDHRIIDGVEASEFLQSVKNGIESITADSDLK